MRLKYSSVGPALQIVPTEFFIISYTQNFGFILFFKKVKSLLELPGNRTPVSGILGQCHDDPHSHYTWMDLSDLQHVIKHKLGHHDVDVMIS